MYTFASVRNFLISIENQHSCDVKKIPTFPPINSRHAIRVSIRNKLAPNFIYHARNFGTIYAFLDGLAIQLTEYTLKQNKQMNKGTNEQTNEQNKQTNFCTEQTSLNDV